MRNHLRQIVPSARRAIALNKGKMEAAGIEPASRSLPESLNSRGFEVSFDLGCAGTVVLYEHPDMDVFMWTPRWGPKCNGGGLPLDEAIPQLERILETAKLVYYGSTQEVRS